MWIFEYNQNLAWIMNSSNRYYEWNKHFWYSKKGEDYKNWTYMFTGNGLLFCCTGDRFRTNSNTWGNRMLGILSGLCGRRKDIMRIFLNFGRLTEQGWNSGVCPCMCMRGCVRVCPCYIFICLSLDASVAQTEMFLANFKYNFLAS